MHQNLKNLVAFLRPEKSRLIQLDVLRGTAILLVLAAHHETVMRKAGDLQSVANFFSRFGWSGVDLFFVLSGFLVGGLLFNELKARSSLDVGRFIIRRGFKIWPGYFVYLGFLGIFYSKANGFSQTSKMLLPNILQIQNYFGATHVGDHTWSLAVEEHFYLFLPFVLYFATKKKEKGFKSISCVPIIAVSLMLFCTLARYLTFISVMPEEWWFVWYPTHLRMDSLFCGVLLAYLIRYRTDYINKITKYRSLLLLLGLVFVSPMFVVDWNCSVFVLTIGFTMLYLGYGSILLATVRAPIDSGWSGRFFKSIFARSVAFIGYFSYSIYLWHFAIGMATGNLLRPFRSMGGGIPISIVWIISFVFFMLSSVIGGVIMGVIVERPALAVRDRFFPSRASLASKG